MRAGEVEASPTGTPPATEELTAMKSLVASQAEEIERITKERDAADTALQQISVMLGGPDEWTDQATMIHDALEVASSMTERCKELEEELATLKKDVDDLIEEAREEERQEAATIWPEWADKLLKILRGYGVPCDDEDGVDLPEELREWLSVYEHEIRSARALSQTTKEGTDQATMIHDALETAPSMTERCKKLETALKRCDELFALIRCDWSDPRSECREGRAIIARALSTSMHEVRNVADD